MNNNDVPQAAPRPNPNEMTGRTPAPAAQTPQPAPGGMAKSMPPMPDGKKRNVTLKRSVFILLVVGIVAALALGYIVGRLTVVYRANAVISQKNSRIEKLETSLGSVKKQLADAQARLDPSGDDDGDSDSAGIQQGSIGQTVTNGGIDMKLISAGEQPTISFDTCGDRCSNGSYAPKSPDTDTKYWVAVVEVKNNTKQPLDITCSYPYDIKALNSDNQQYTPIDNLYNVEGNPECNAELQPGLSTQVTYPFQVPLDVKMIAIAFRDVGDILSGESGEEEPSYLIADDNYKVSGK